MFFYSKSNLRTHYSVNRRCTICLGRIEGVANFILVVICFTILKRILMIDKNTVLSLYGVESVSSSIMFTEKVLN